MSDTTQQIRPRGFWRWYIVARIGCVLHGHVWLVHSDVNYDEYEVCERCGNDRD